MAAPSAPLLVVGPQFCPPHVLPLTLAMKYNGRCTVDDASGAAVLRMEEVPFFSFRRHYVLVDAAGVPVVSLKAKAKHFGGLSWQVFRGDSHDAGDLLFTATAFYLGNSDKMIASVCSISAANQHIPVNRMKSSGRPVFGVTVFPHADHVHHSSCFDLTLCFYQH
ncbi:hypothetical protein SETIT_2G089900v2 [Setaria italica]|uniref:Uncharacterized protein n=1 Tax=Setaria italica TaxID=4555 RepID=K4A389_SETIT|nr:hypothetical protein SETIT_2G089900v2 [Setaria italica]